MSATGTVTTNQDADENDETFTVALGNLPSSVTQGTPNSVQVTIRDDDGGTAPTKPTVRLSTSPNPVTEGSSVTVTATLSAALAGNVTIPLTLTDDTAESGDDGTLSSITIAAGATSGTSTVTTNQDTDEDDETFTVALDTGSLPSSVSAGSPASVTITISDDDGGTAPTKPTVRLSASPNPVTEGSSVTVTATLSAALTSSVAIPLTLDRQHGGIGRPLTISEDDLAFDSATTSYTVDVAHDVSSVTVTPTANDAAATITVNGATVASGSESAPITLETGENPIEVVVTAEDGTTRTYTVTVTRAALPATLTLSNDPDPAEGSGEVTVTTTLDEPAPEDGTTVTLTTGGTATLGADYTLSSTTITIAEGDTEGTATITVIDDAEDEAGETIVPDAESVNPALTAATLTLTIEDNDAPGRIASPDLLPGEHRCLRIPATEGRHGVDDQSASAAGVGDGGGRAVSAEHASREGADPGRVRRAHRVPPGERLHLRRHDPRPSSCLTGSTPTSACMVEYFGGATALWVPD